MTSSHGSLEASVTSNGQYDVSAEIRSESGRVRGNLREDAGGAEISISSWTDGEDVGGQVECFGYVVAGERQVLNVDGTKATSAFEYAEDGSLKSYSGIAAETSGTVKATYLGGGMSSDFNLGFKSHAQAVVTGDVCNDNDTSTHEETQDFVRAVGQVKETRTQSDVDNHSSEGIVICERNLKSHSEQHAANEVDGKVTESRIPTDSVDNSTTAFGIRIGGSQSVRKHAETTTTTTETGWLYSTQKKETITEDLECTQSHSLFTSEIDIAKEERCVEEELSWNIPSQKWAVASLSFSSSRQWFYTRGT